MLLVLSDSGEELFRVEDAFGDLRSRGWAVADGKVLVTGEWLAAVEALRVNRMQGRLGTAVGAATYIAVHLGRRITMNQEMGLLPAAGDQTYTSVRALDLQGTRWVVERASEVHDTFHLWPWPEGEECPTIGETRPVVDAAEANAILAEATGLVGKIQQERLENRAGLPDHALRADWDDTPPIRAIERQALYDRQMFARVHIPAEQIAAQQERPFIRAIEREWEAIRREAVRMRMLQMLEEGRRIVNLHLQEDTAPHQQDYIEDDPPF